MDDKLQTRPRPPKRAERFESKWQFQPLGDQPQAIAQLVEGLNAGMAEQVLLGVTGSGKTFTIANVIAAVQRPALVIAPNKTLAAQLFQEFKEIFPDSAVEYFISYYDYYQPEAYVPSTDTFIDKSATINQDIDKMRHSATRVLFERRDVIIVSSVSCIYGLGDPEAYLKAMVVVEVGERLQRDYFLQRLINIRYERNDISLERGKFRVRGDLVEVVPSHERDRSVRVEFWGEEVERICIVDSLKGTVIEEVNRVAIYPSSHYVTDAENMDVIVDEITADLKERVSFYTSQNMFLEAQRVQTRTQHDLEMMKEMGYCQGIENYSRYLSRRPAGMPPPTLLDYFPKDFLCIIDESHITLPQIGGMYRGDRARKETLVNFGFRLPAALDNRPLNFEEFRERIGQAIYVSATPGEYELKQTQGIVVEQLIRPTGLIDPEIVVLPATGQIDDLLEHIHKAVEQGGRVLITTLTKKMAEELTTYYRDLGVKIKYLHSDIDTIERIEILRDLRAGIFDVLVGINLLREGLDLPEVQLVAILDADKEGFLRSRVSLIQMVGRAARNSQGRVILYADRMTGSILACIQETDRRRLKQIEYNKENDVTPQTVKKKIPEKLRKMYNLDFGDEEQERLNLLLEELGGDYDLIRNPAKAEKFVQQLMKEMKKASAQLDFERAAALRDKIHLLKNQILAFGGEV